MPRVRCNRLMTQSFVPVLPAGMACALSESGGRTESQEGVDAVLEAPCGTARRVPRWTAGTDEQRASLPPGTGGAKEDAMATRPRGSMQGHPPRRATCHGRGARAPELGVVPREGAKRSRARRARPGCPAGAGKRARPRGSRRDRALPGVAVAEHERWGAGRSGGAAPGKGERKSRGFFERGCR
jgi:hypothetical protein